MPDLKACSGGLRVRLDTATCTSLRVAVFAMVAAPAFAQQAQSCSGGAVDSASWRGQVTLGSIAAIFGTNLASTTQSAQRFPLPT